MPSGMYCTIHLLEILRLSREPGKEKTKVRPDCSFAPTQLALCLRPCLLPTLKGESCYAPSQPSMTRLHNAELVNYECGRMNPLLCSRHHRQVTLAVKT